MIDPIVCFDYVGEDYSYDQCMNDYHAFMRDMYAYEARTQAMDHESHMCDTKEVA